MPAIRAEQRPPAWRWAQWLLVAIGAASLGYVVYSFADAEVFQAYESWRLHRATVSSRQPSDVAPSSFRPTASITRAHVQHGAIVSGSALGRIEIARIGISVIIAEGTDARTLRRAVGHIRGTAFPGEVGNVAISGHRDTYFRPLRDIRLGDEIRVTTTEGVYLYRVDSMRVVGAQEVAVLNDSADSVLTLVTCYPFYFVGPAPKRFIVHAHRM
jgi:sortase A